MFTINPFAGLSAFVSPAIMQTYLATMMLLVAGGTLFDIVHKKSAKYFFNNWQTVKRKATRPVDSGQMTSLAIQTALTDVLASGEFCNSRRRIAHLLTMYGFICYVMTTIAMVCAYPAPATQTPAIITALWWIGALMVCAGGYWFWFFIRVDVAAEGNSHFRIVQADLFILSLLASTTLGLMWALTQSADSPAGSYVILALYLIATTVLFGAVPWSKFSHMFYKPAAAFQKRIEQANGSRRNLPPPADKPATFGSARRRPQHY
jgi:hypothetical protein